MKNEKDKNRSRYHVGATSVLRRCVIGFVGSAICASAGQAQAWSEFQARCLGAFEHLEPIVTEGATRLQGELVGTDVLLSEHAVQFDLGEGVVLHSDPAPVLEGERLCAIEAAGAIASEVSIWLQAALDAGDYEEHDAEQGRAVISTLWIEPRLTVTLRLSEDGTRVIYQILETHLES